MSETTVPIHVPKSTHTMLKERAQRQGKKLYRMCDEILKRSFRAQAKNGGKR